MNLMSLVVALVAGIILFEPFTRAPVSRSMRVAACRNRAMRSFMQAGVAVMASLMIATSQPAPERLSPLLLFGVAALLALAGVYWIVRGARLLKPRRMFIERH